MTELFLMFFFVLAVIFTYYCTRIPIEPESNKTVGLDLLMSIGAILVPIGILGLADSIYWLFRGKAIENAGGQDLFTSVNYENETIAIIISLIAQVIMFGYFIIYYDKNRRTNLSQTILINISIILFLINGFGTML